MILKSWKEKSRVPATTGINLYFYFQINAFYFSVIKEEAIDSRAEVKSFDKSHLKHVETEEKHFMPSAQGDDV